ncbi:MAG: GTP cyclohydrolase, FolE2/MptA family [Desulfurococcaceae archaeon]
MQNPPDVHNEKPRYPLRVCRAGIKGVKLLPVKVGNYWITPLLSVLVDLPENLRGVHVSRLYRTVYEVFTAMGKLDYEFLDALATKLLEVHKASSTVDVEVSANVIGKGNLEFSAHRGISMRLVKSRGGEKTMFSSVSFVVIAACPCALTVSEHMYSKPYTHNSRMKVVVTLRSKEYVPSPIELLELYNNVFPTPRNYLNRVEEAEYVKNLVETPRFAEDVAREAAYTVLERYSKLLGRHGAVFVTVKSEEPHHEFKLAVNLKMSTSDHRFN